MHQSHPNRRKDKRAGMTALIAALCVSAPAIGDVIYQQDFESWNNASGLWSTNTRTDLGAPYSKVLGRFGAQTVTLDLLATPENTAGLSGSGGDSNPFNLTVRPVSNNQHRIPFPDSGGGGGGPIGPIGSTPPNGPIFNLGQAIQDANTSEPVFGPGKYAVNFDLMLFDSWDGNWAPNGADSFAVSVNGQTLFDEFLYSEAYGPDLNFRNPDETPATNAYNTRWVDSIYRNIELSFELTSATDLLSIDFIGRTTQSVLDESWGIDNIGVRQLPAGRSESTPSVPVPGTLVLLGSGLGLAARRKR
jgi:hypothetical protein